VSEVRLRRTTYPIEAHLSPSARTAPIVRFFPRKRRNVLGWIVFFSFIILNEMRGVYVVAQFLKGWYS
jgi:hypothetical protein